MAQLLTGMPSDAPIAKKPELADSVSGSGLLTAPSDADLAPSPNIPEPSSSVTVYGFDDTDDGRGSAKPEELPDSVPEVSSAFLTAMNAVRPPAEGGSDAPVDLQADQLKHNQETNTVLASGNVMLMQQGRILRADEVEYNLDEDRVIARGNVVLNEPGGDIHLAQEVEFSNGFKDGFVQGLQTILADGSQFWAKNGKRKDAKKIEMRSATYTPCEVCENDPDAEPAWQLRASDVIYHEDENRIAYKNARFEIYGVPVAYLPYFSHPDGSVTQKSGFLPPSIGFKSDLGTFIEQYYYYAVSPSTDVSLGVLAMTNDNPMALAQWRKRWDDAEIILDGGLTYSERTDRINGQDVPQEEEIRGHVMGKGRWDIDQKWRAGFNVNYASDDQYMRQYDFTNEDVLENEIYLERFSGRNYAVGRILSFQDIRLRDERNGFTDVDQPEILPEIMASFIGNPDFVPLVGGRWALDLSTLGLNRDGNGQDVNRLSLNASWEKRSILESGFVTDIYASARGDYYNVRDRDVARGVSNVDDSTNEARFFPQIHAQASYPLAKQLEHSQVIVEPMAALTLAPNLNLKSGIPNEDSQDVQIDASNLFEPNRFPGLDEVEDQSRVTYGLRTGVYGFDGSYGNVFFGQSQRFEEDDNPFPQGSGLDERRSDFVGEISGGYQDSAYLNYRFQLANDNLSSQRHEIDGFFAYGAFSMGSNYIFAKALEGTDLTESREQFKTNMRYKFNDEWAMRVGGTQDLGEDPGLRKAYTALDYTGQCVSWTLTGERNLTDEASGDSETEILFRIGLKNLSEL